MEQTRAGVSRRLGPGLADRRLLRWRLVRSQPRRRPAAARGIEYRRCARLEGRADCLAGKIILLALRTALAWTFIHAGVLKIWDFSHARPATPDFVVAIQQYR